MMKRMISVLLILTMMLSMAAVSPVVAETMAAEEKTGEELVLIPDESCWEYEENNDGTISITGFDDRNIYTLEDRRGNNPDKNTYKLIVPATISGKEVYEVEGILGYTYRKITSLKIPEGVISISNIRASGSSLSEVELPSTLKYIGYQSFVKATELKSITIPDSVEFIDIQAFFGCTSLKNIAIPAGVERIDEAAFADCQGLQYFEVSSDNERYYAEDGLLYERWTEEVPIYGDEVDEDGDPIKESSEMVERKRLICYPGAKKGIYNITADLYDYEWTAFLNVKGLTAINVVGDNQYYTSVDGVLYEKDMSILQVCPAGKTGEYTVPEGVYSLQTNSFSNSSLSTLHLPDSLLGKHIDIDGNEREVFIGNYSFDHCDSLKTLTLGKNTTEEIIPHFRYYDECANLENITVSDDNPYICAIDNVVYDKEMKKLLYVTPTKEGKIILPDSVENSNRVISGDSVTELVLGRNYKVTTKRDYDYDDVDNYYIIAVGLPNLPLLETYSVSPENENLAVYDGILYSRDMTMLYHCPPRKKGEIVIPDGCTTILMDSFEGYHGGGEDNVVITIPASVTKIYELPCYSGITVKGYAGSYAEKYVNELNSKGKNILFIPIVTSPDASGTVPTAVPDTVLPNPAVSTAASPTPTAAPTSKPSVSNKKPSTSSLYSSYSSVTRPKKVTLKSVKKSGRGSLKVKWKKVSGADGYYIQYALNRSFTKGRKKVWCSGSYSSDYLYGLKSKKTYYVRVRAYKYDTYGSDLYGKWSSVKKCQVK